jgi:hypothetical protein
MLGCIFLSFGLYLHYAKYYLHETELWILFYANIMLLSLIYDGWLTYIVYLPMMGAQTVLILSLVK